MAQGRQQVLDLGTRKFGGVSSSPAACIVRTKRGWMLEVVVGNILKFKSIDG